VPRSTRLGRKACHAQPPAPRACRHLAYYRHSAHFPHSPQANDFTLPEVAAAAFKPNTDDLRDAPALTLIGRLLGAGARVKAYDPVAMDAVAAVFPTVRMASGAYEVASDCDALVLITDWPEFRALDVNRLREAMRTPVFIDGRNMFDPAQMAAAGFRYVGFGR
jgi:UDPglucose 6-dehydrogenase